jgi:hypothetical protein
MRYLFGFICVMALSVMGCGEEEGKPCEETRDCAVEHAEPPHWTLPDDRCTFSRCEHRVCINTPVDCQGDYMTGKGCRTVEFTECNPDAEKPCGTLTPIREGMGCNPNCSGHVCNSDGRCVCRGWCVCGLGEGAGGGCSATQLGDAQVAWLFASFALIGIWRTSRRDQNRR